MFLEIDTRPKQGFENSLRVILEYPTTNQEQEKQLKDCAENIPHLSLYSIRSTKSPDLQTTEMILSFRLSTNGLEGLQQLTDLLLVFAKQDLLLKEKNG